MSTRKLKVLLEMRPALDGHAGIPQETRLLFRGLCHVDEIEVEGLLQSSGRVLSKGLSPVASGGNRDADKEIYRLSKVVISLQEDLANPHLAAALMALRRLLGGHEHLARFDATHFRDFIWRMLFAKTLTVDDFDTVTRAGFRIARVPWTAMHRCALAFRHAGYALYPRLDTSDFDIMIAETPYPGIVSKRTRLVVRYHDAIPVLMPHTIADKPYHQASHYHALRRNVASGAMFACVSETTRSDLLSIFPQAESQAVTIHNMISTHYFAEQSSPARIAEILATRANETLKGMAPSGMTNGEAPKYLLMVSTIEPRKNHSTLLAAWEQLRYERFPDLKLVVVGMLGWDHENIVNKFRPWLERGQMFVLEDVPSPELRLLYRHARATVCPSYSEGFDFSGVEAMRCGTAVIASDIPVHREVYAGAAEYFSPYSPAALAKAIVDVVAPESPGRRDQLIGLGANISAQYTPDALLPKWQAFLRKAGDKRI